MAERPRGFDVNQPGSTRESLIGLAQGATTDLIGGVVDAGDAVGSLAAKIPYTPFLLALSQLKGSSDTLGSEALGSRIYGKAPTEELQRIRDDARLVGGIVGIGELATAKLANLTAKGIADFLPYLKGVDEVAVTPEGVPIPVKNLPDTSVTKMIAGRNSTSGRSRENMAKEQRKMGKSEEEIYRSTGAYFDSDVLGMDVDAFRHEIPNAEKSTLKIGKIDSTKSSYSPKGGDYFYSKDRVSFGFKPDVSEYQYNPETEALFYNPLPKGAKFEDGSQDLGWNPKLGEILDYPELFEEYPQLRDLMVVKLSSPSVKVGGDTKRFGGFYLHDGPRGKPVIALADAQTVLPEQDFQSRLLHEVQHAIQAIEATPGGGEFIRIYEGLKDRLGVEGDSDYVMGRAIDFYESLYGEVEARIVQQRFLNPELKKESPVQTRKKEAADTDIIIDEDDAIDVGEQAIRDELEYGDVGYEEVYPEQFSGRGSGIQASLSTGLLGGDKPKRFYHGSKTGFKEFDPDAEVTFVADRPSTAEYYTDFRDVYGRFPTQAEGANIRPVYLKDVNFFDVDNPEHIKQLRESDWYKSKKAELDDGFTYPEEGDFVDVVEAGNYEVIEGSGLIDWIKSQGFDGFTTYEQDGKNYGVFNVENIVPGVAKKAEGGVVSLLDMAQNMNRGPKGVASLSSVARNMNRPMVS